MFGHSKSKYKRQKRGWGWFTGEDDDEQDDATKFRGSRSGYFYGGGGYGGYDYGYSYYKPRYDMSYSLALRVNQLIRTVTGKDLKVVQAEGWGNDDRFFFYNPVDLENASDDEVLGRVLQQLGKELFVDREQTQALKDKDRPYRHLVDALEANRADRLLADRYPGTTYYASELWAARKFTDNPILSYEKLMTLEEYIERNFTGHSWKYNELPTSSKSIVDSHYAEYKERSAKSAGQNDAWEFCFNIHAVQNGETAFDFTKDEVAANFAKALPYIDQYLSAASFEEAQGIYPKIKELYPKPDDDQQQQMDKKMSQTQGLSQSQLAALAKMASAREEQEMAEKGEREGAQFMRDFANDFRFGRFNDEKASRAAYEQWYKEYQGEANVLFSLIRSILKDNQAKRFVRPFKRGKLDAKRLYKLISTGNTRVFKKPRAISQKDYLMTLVVDMSGSMSGNNGVYAAKSAIVMAEVLEKLGFAYEVIAYNGSVYTVKKFNERLKKEMLPILAQPNGDNNEPEVIKTLIDHAKKFDSANRYRKGVFWITDGQAYDPDYVKKQVGQFERDHNAAVFAIGIGDVDSDYLEASYPHYINVQKISQLPRELIGLMRSQFRRG